MPGGFVASLQKNPWNMEVINSRQADSASESSFHG